MQLVNDPLHLAEVETSAIIKILFESWAEHHWHWLYSVADGDTDAHYRPLYPRPSAGVTLVGAA